MTCGTRMGLQPKALQMEIVRKRVYTRFSPALDRITKSEPGEVQDFVDLLQTKLDEVLTMGTSVGTTPDTLSLQDSDEVIE